MNYPARPIQPTSYYYTPQAMYVPAKRTVNHALHLLLTLITFGLWAIVWIAVAIDVSRYNNHQAREYDAAIRRMQYAQMNPQTRQGGPQR